MNALRPTSASIIPRFPLEILENIAVHIVFDDPHGHPAGLVPLLCTCKAVYGLLSYSTNNTLCARVFKGMFDFRAARRRVGRITHMSSNLAAQLKLQCETLRRIRARDLSSPSLVDDFWVAFVMMSENDGRNRIQLEKAGLPELLEIWVRQGLWERNRRDEWPADDAVRSLGLWLLWFMTDEAKLSVESPQRRAEIMSAVRPYVLLPCRYPAFLVPDNHFNVPLDWDDETGPERPPHSMISGHGPWPVYRDPETTGTMIWHYGRQLHVVTPLITLAAELVFFSRREVDPIGIPPNIPRNRAEAVALGRQEPSPTLEDIIEFRNKHTVILPRATWNWEESLTAEELAAENECRLGQNLKSLSSKWDDDWARWTCCWNAWEGQMLKSPVFTPGSLRGLWQGRMLYPAEMQYRSLIVSPHVPQGFGEMSPFVTNAPLYMRLREHHCISPAQTAALGGDGQGFDDGVLNGWLPNGVRLREYDDKLFIHDPDSDSPAIYDTYDPDKPSSHKPETCARCQQRLHALTQESRERVTEELAVASESPDGNDFDLDELFSDLEEEDFRGTDFVDDRCRGIQDFVITGETDDRHGRAWGHYVMYGRIRHWDGMICIVRQPRDPRLGRLIFRGYLVGGQNFVGFWRLRTDAGPGAIPWEAAQSSALPPHGRMTKLVVSKLFDPETEQFITNRIITVSEDSGLVLDVTPFSSEDVHSVLVDSRTVDLRGLTVLPGLVDTHVHFFLHPYSEVSWEDQLTKESLAERTVRATVHARSTVMAGFTAVRDLGTEGAEDADISLRKCLSGPSPLIAGPRYFCANRAIVPTGAYGPKSLIRPNQDGIDGITGAEVADGVVECTKAVRRQIGAGADWIKIYADYRFRSRLGVGVSNKASRASIATFTRQELEAMVKTSEQYGVKVAAHSTERLSMQLLRHIGVHSIEHGYNIGSGLTSAALKDELRLFAQSKTFWVPTLAAYYTLGQDGGQWEAATATFKAALEVGMDNIACGGDTGVFSHGDNSFELKLMVRLGAPVPKVLRWATLGGWRLVRSAAWEGTSGMERLARIEELNEDLRIVGDNEVPFGMVRKGFAADIIAVHGDVEADFEKTISKESVRFVMKGGKILKKDGLETFGCAA
ncbi:hypothetical protein PUNSTDRAFT_140632 [Punctularia strigosozonata HHB-11173 SS5]|uniref:uncharacterized protein n=1 Tax=Punctularia strigosozonata (strain HHB-11173) TaxID=741275 RepID=UPI00044185A2|nr:uncharacterized protein PUNSTDRAFT_140632 [Punctularia strigosozonata HHB-11173 SS5]EIN14315.1 hypothetical protein PUNSTDRAFT_140632 [Punctularia strigosozonata HHB-11173 SS5]